MGKTYIIAKLARVIMWVMSGIVGASASQSEAVATEVAGYAVAGAMALVSWYLSVKHDKKLKASPPDE